MEDGVFPIGLIHFGDRQNQVMHNWRTAYRAGQFDANFLLGEDRHFEPMDSGNGVSCVGCPSFRHCYPELRMQEWRTE